MFDNFVFLVMTLALLWTWNFVVLGLKIPNVSVSVLPYLKKKEFVHAVHTIVRINLYPVADLLPDEVDALYLPISGSVEEHMEGIGRVFDSTP